MTTNHTTHPRRSGFTLIELLTVIAIIGLLAGILIPTTGVVLNKVREARSKNTFSNYATALVSYRQEYGVFPPFSGSLPFEVNPNIDEFHSALSGKNSSGGPGNRALNRKLISFYTFSENDYDDAGNISDAFGNTDIHINFEPTQGAGIQSGTGGYPTDDVNFTWSSSGDVLQQPVIVWSEGTNSSMPTIRSWD